jgi:hypothetical protein
MATSKYSDLNSAPSAGAHLPILDSFFNQPAEFRPPEEPGSKTGFYGLDTKLSTPAEIHRVGDHTVEIHRDPATHVAITEEWRNKDGQWDRADGAAIIERGPKTGIVDGEEWIRNNLNHRIGGPAVWHRDDTGVIGVEHYYVDGKLHREGGPAWTHRDPDTGAVISQAWYRHGERLPDPNERLLSPGPSSRHSESPLNLAPASVTFSDIIRAASRRSRQSTDKAAP